MTKPRTVFLLMIAALVLPAVAASAQICPSLPRTFPLVVKATTVVGSVRVVNDLTNLYVTVTTIAPYSIDQLQLHAAPTLLGIPMTITGAPKKTRFAKQASFQPGVTTFSFTSPLGTFRPGALKFIAVHALVHQGATCRQSGDDDDHEHESDDASAVGSFQGFSSSGGSHSDDHHGEEHNSDDDGHCSDVRSDDDHDGHSSVSGHSSSSGSHSSGGQHSDDHHGEDREDDDEPDHNCSCSKQSAWAGNLLFPGDATATYFTFALNCGLPE